MLSYETRNKLADYLLAVSDGERQIEIVRQILAEQKDFEPYAAFKRIDRHRRGSIGTLEILNFLADNGVFYTENNVRAFIQRYDQDGDERLCYNEFLFAVLPMDNPTLRAIATQRPNYTVGPNEFLPYDVEYALTKVIDREISFYLNLEYQKTALKNRFDYTPTAAFAAIDQFNSGRIDYDNLKSFFRGQAIFPNDDEIIAILRRLDKDDDGLIHFDEFEAALKIGSLGGSSPRKHASSPSRRLEKQYSSPVRSSSRSPTRRLLSTAGTLDSGSPKKIATIQHPHVRASPSKRTASPQRSSPLKQSLVERSASPLRRSNLYTEFNKPVTRAESPSRRKSPGKSPKRTAYDEMLYEEKLLQSVEKPLKKSNVYASFSGEKATPSTSLYESASKSGIRKGLQFDEGQFDPLIHTFKQFILLDKDLETAKQDLALKPDFNLLEFFRLFDVEQKGVISIVEVEDGMRLFGVYPNREELYLFVRKYDRDNDGKLRFNDLAEAFTPKAEEYANILESRKPIEINPEIDVTVNRMKLFLTL